MRRNREQQKTGRQKQVGAPQEQSKPRETHKLLQVRGWKARRKKLPSPKSIDVRPMIEVVKGAAFGILQALLAISRGCSEVHFVEMDPWVVFDVLRPNFEWTSFFDNLVTHAVCVETYLERTKGDPFDYTSAIPPYMLVDYEILIICDWRLFFYSCGVSIPNRYAENMFVPREVI